VREDGTCVITDQGLRRGLGMAGWDSASRLADVGGPFARKGLPIRDLARILHNLAPQECKHERNRMVRQNFRASATTEPPEQTAPQRISDAGHRPLMALVLAVGLGRDSAYRSQ
jgi:hypothetical protein